MKHNFDEVIDRGPNSLTYSSKWQRAGAQFKDYNIDYENTLFMWIADMDFRCPQSVVDAVISRAQHGIYGYSSDVANERFRKAGAAWFQEHYSWGPTTDQMIFSPGVLSALNTVIQEYTMPGDGIIIQNPVYNLFSIGIKNNDRNIISNNLIYTNGRYEIDFEDLEAKAKDPNTNLLILSSPHNPVGRVWREDELRSMFDICKRHGVLVFADEVHSDLIFSNAKFFSCGRLEEYYEYMILAHSASKTFNLAGLSASLITILDNELRARFVKRMGMNKHAGSNVFGPIAGAVAYETGSEYVKSLVEYIENNVNYVREYFATHIPKVRMIEPEGTYLVWFDFTDTGLSANEIYCEVLEKAKIVGNFGSWFDAENSTKFMRFNFACPFSNIEDFAKRMRASFGN